MDDQLSDANAREADVTKPAYLKPQRRAQILAALEQGRKRAAERQRTIDERNERRAQKGAPK